MDDDDHDDYDHDDYDDDDDDADDADGWQRMMDDRWSINNDWYWVMDNGRWMKMVMIIMTLMMDRWMVMDGDGRWSMMMDDDQFLACFFSKPHQLRISINPDFAQQYYFQPPNHLQPVARGPFPIVNPPGICRLQQ